MEGAHTSATPRSAAHWAVLGGALAGLLVVAALGLFLEPDPRGHGTHEQLGLRACPALERFEVPCPLCGVTTSAVLAARGQVVAAARNQPAGLLLVVAAVGFALWAVGGHLAGRDLGRGLGRLRWRRWVVVGAALVLGAWLYKVALATG